MLKALSLGERCIAARVPLAGLWWLGVQESASLSHQLEMHQMLSECVEETLIRNLNFVDTMKDFKDRTR